MIDPSSSDEESDNEGVEETQHQHHHHHQHHRHPSQRGVAQLPGAKEAVYTVLGSAPAQLPGAGAPAHPPASQWGGGASGSNSLDVPPVAGPQSR